MTNTPPSCRKRTQRDYNLGFKLAVVEQIEKGEMTYKQAQKAYGIQGRSTVLVWLRKHGKLDWSIPTELPMSQSKETPAQQIKRLEKELEDERLRILVLEGMVDIKHHIQPSMTDGYDCYQNALAERVNGILKQEFLLYRCKTFEDLRVLVAESIDTYNRLRPHLSLGMKTPEEVHKKAGCEWQPA